MVIRSISTFAVAVVTFIIIAILAWRNGRTYCNTICPVGTVLGLLSRFSLLKPVIDTEKCINCKLCARKCKASCIDAENHSIDYSRCVVCMDCLESCSKGAIKYTFRKGSKKSAVEAQEVKVDKSRRNFIVGAGLLATSAVKAQEMKLDGGYATIIDKQSPFKDRALTPPGSLSARNMEAHCTGCQLCVAVCPTQVLRPSADLKTQRCQTVCGHRGAGLPLCCGVAAKCRLVRGRKSGRSAVLWV